MISLGIISKYCSWIRTSDQHNPLYYDFPRDDFQILILPKDEGEHPTEPGRQPHRRHPTHGRVVRCASHCFPVEKVGRQDFMHMITHLGHPTPNKIE